MDLRVGHGGKCERTPDIYDLQASDIGQLAGNNREDLLRKIISSMGSNILSLARRIVRNDTTAEEVAQDVFLAIDNLLRRPGTLRERLGPWIMSVTKNKSLSKLKRKERWNYIPLDHEILVGNDGRNSEKSPYPAAGDGIEKAMSELTEKQRNVLRMRIWDGHSFGDISEELGMTQEAARQQFSRAVRAISKALKGM